MRRALRFAAAFLAAAVAATAWTVREAAPASAVDASQVVGTYVVKLKGDGWWRGSRPEDTYRAQRVSTSAQLRLSRRQPDDGKLHVEIWLLEKDAKKLVGLATPKSPAPGPDFGPAFVGDAFLVGDSMAVIDSGGPTYVNVLTLQFVKDGARVAGHWLSSFPATDAAAGAGSAIGIDFAGRRKLLPTRARVAR